MTNNRKLIGETALLLLAGAVALAFSAPLQAQSDISARYARWELNLRNRINDQLAYPIAANGAAGDVLVGFRVGDDGKPINVVVRKSSGFDIFDRAAARLVSGLGRIGPVPSSTRSIDEIVVKLSYGDPSSTIAGTMQLARKDRAEQLAAERRDRALVASSTNLAEGR